MIIVFMPALVVLLTAKEREAGRALTQQEVEDIRDTATAISLSVDMAGDMERERGYIDLDPENIWEDWNTYTAKLKEN